MDLSFVTYNIHKAIGTDRLFSPERIIQVCRDLNPDVLALQEVPYFFQRTKNKNIAKIISKELGLQYSIGLNVKLKRGAYGNATFSRYPIEHSNNLNITWSIKKPRGCLSSLVNLPGDQYLALMNFHLGLSGIERKNQLSKILRSLFLMKHQRHPMVLMGDTNDAYNRLGHHISKAGFQEPFDGDKKSKTFPSYAPIWKLDRLYYNHGFTLEERLVVRNRLTRIASDHLPVFVRLKIKDRK